ncbi:Spore cortex-lytic enzyme precursor [Tsuneonella dongtanensis]|uniref:Spore cortex-lytic enzyme n=1 Tax=Tsuneonella dongtanensis TaxID=692370 RepID=A0A1B2ACL0_9SPHN|nr:cell wall hydrolase [Tsuneonella dongtanensis]ANY19838.1 Spore cortex-lytic enzyme precursor [Tsuneonella dongtanensis]
MNRQQATLQRIADRRERRDRRRSLTPRALFEAVFRGPHSGRRLLALAAAVAVPAMAAPGDWRALDFDTAVEAEAAAMPFETPGESFPGSAFFYLEDLPQLALDHDAGPPPPIETGAHSDAEPARTDTLAGPAARAFLGSGTGIDKARALQCMTLALYYESANEPTEGQRAVAQVILNRVAHPSYPNSVCGVVFQGSERKTGCQFSFTCDGSLNRKPAKASWDRARGVAAASLAGYVYAPIGLATHYHATYVLPYWASSLTNVGTIGLHTFYKWRGVAGRSDAFAARYAGREPVAAPHPRSYTDPAGSAPDPVVLAQAYEAARMKAVAASAAYAPPPPPVYAAPVQARGGDRLYAAENLPQTGTVKAEYANSGRWIAQPGATPAADVNAR